MIWPQFSRIDRISCIKLSTKIHYYQMAMYRLSASSFVLVVCTTQWLKKENRYECNNKCNLYVIVCYSFVHLNIYHITYYLFFTFNISTHTQYIKVDLLLTALPAHCAVLERLLATRAFSTSMVVDFPHHIFILRRKWR